MSFSVDDRIVLWLPSVIKTADAANGSGPVAVMSSSPTTAPAGDRSSATSCDPDGLANCHAWLRPQAGNPQDSAVEKFHITGANHVCGGRCIQRSTNRIASSG